MYVCTFLDSQFMFMRKSGNFSSHAKICGVKSLFETHISPKFPD